MSEELKALAKEFKARLGDNASGPLILAGRVLVIADVWDGKYRPQTGKDDLSFSAWLHRETGYRLSWYQVRAAAVEALGESIRRTLHHEVAVYVFRSVPKEKWTVAVDALDRARIQKGGRRPPLTMAKAIRILAPILGRTKEAKTCPRCLMLQARVRELEAQLGVNQAAE